MSNKINIIGLIALTILTGACGKRQDLGLVQVEKELQPYYNKFISQLNTHGREDVINKSITLRFIDDIPTPVGGKGVILGHCIGPSGLVEISRKSWAWLSPTQKEILILHELGHCVLNRGHDDEVLPGMNAHLSIMSTYLLSSVNFENKYDYYIKELIVAPKSKDIPAFLSEKSNFSPLIASKVSELGKSGEEGDHSHSNEVMGGCGFTIEENQVGEN